MFSFFTFQAESWITEKLQTASDESYKDPANLESKLQKHQAFEAELTAHEEAIDAVRETGEELMTSGHFAAEEVERRIEALYLHWEELLEASATKGKRLEEARDHQKFNQEVDIADSCISEKVRRWCDVSQSKSEDYVKPVQNALTSWNSRFYGRHEMSHDVQDQKGPKYCSLLRSRY